MRILCTLFIYFVFSACQNPASTESDSHSETVPLSQLTEADSLLTRFEGEILAFEEADQLTAPEKGGVLFVGSSSIRLWHSFDEDLAGLPVLQRGIGGSTLPEVIHYFDRVVLPYQPKAIFLYEGDNDLLAESCSPQDYLADVQEFWGMVKGQLPGTTLYLIAVKPSIARRQYLAKAQEANTLMADYSEKNEAVHYVDIFSPMMQENGTIKPEIFIEDSLHMNREGYQLWKAVIRPLVLAESKR